MKTLKSIICALSLVFLGFSVGARENKEEKLNLPGDNLNLYAVMDLFRESETLEGFEKNLNAEDSKINNLDLNGDDRIDYIKVLDYVDGDVHTIVLQVAVNEKENQDVAVFTVQKDKQNQVQIQLIGDEELYGKDYIIEPIYDDASSVSTPNPGYTANNNTVQKETVVVTKTTYVEVASWPVITYIYVPTYTVWRSPWYWGYYPPYWNPWKPYYWDYYYGYHSHYYTHYYGHYHHSYHHRYPHYNDHYYNGHRAYSNTVNHHRQSGMYRNTYSHPETRSQGSADFTKKYPNGYRSDSKQVNNTSGNRLSAKPGTSTNVSRPTTKQGTRPATVNPSAKPGVSKPATRPATTSPATKSTANKPAARPSTTYKSPKYNANKPATRPSTTTPSTKSGVNKPSTRPSTKSSSAKPANTRTSKPESTKTSTGSKRSGSNSRNEKSK